MIEVERLVFAAEAELKNFEKDMARIPSIVEDVSRKAEQKAAKYAKASEQIQHRLAQAGIREQKKLTDEVLREIDKRNRAESKAANIKSKNGGGFMASFAGNTAANVVGNIASQAKELAMEGVRINASLDNLVRFTATLDKNFQNPIALQRFTGDIKQLSTEIPFTAEKIAAASFSIKSAFSNLSEPQTVEFLRQFGLAATASNADIVDFTKNTIALAKVFKVEMKDLPSFMAKVNATFKEGLAADSDVAAGFNKSVSSIQTLKLTATDYLALMSTVQSSTADAAGATTDLVALFSKLGEGKTIEGLKEVFNIDRFTSDGKLKEVNQIINEIAKSLDGLTEQEKITKINSVFKELNSNQALMTILNNLEKYQTTLKDTSGAESFKNTQNLMMDSVESRWTKLWNNIQNSQSGVGGSISDFFLSAFDSTTVVGGIGIFFSNLGGAVLQGILYLGQSISEPIESFAQYLASFLFSDEQIAASQVHAGKFFSSISDAISQQTTKNIQMVLQGQKANWQKIADATADPDAKAKALKNVESLTKAIKDNANKSLSETYQSYKGVMNSVVKGLASGDETVKKQAAASAQVLVDSINQVLANPNLDPAMAEEFRKLLEELKKTAEQYGITLQKVMFRVGTNVGQGLVSGLNAQQGQVIAAAARLANAVPDTFTDKLIIASPSRLMAEIGKNTVDGYVKGLNDNAKKIKATLTKTIANQVKDLQKELKDALNEFQASVAGYDKTSEARTGLFNVNEQQSIFEDVIRLRNELGINVNKPIVVGDLSREKRELEEVTDRLSGLKSTVDNFLKNDDPLKKFREGIENLTKDASSEGFRKLAEASGKTAEQFKQLATEAITAEFIQSVLEANDEFEKMASPETTRLLLERAEALQKIQDAIDFSPENQRDSVAAQYGVKMPTPDLGGEPPELKIKKAKIEFETLAGFLDQAFTDLRERGWRGMLSGMVLDLTDALQQMFVKWITSQIFKAFNQPMGLSPTDTGGGGGFWSKLLGMGIKAVTGGLSGGFSGGGGFGVYNGPDVGNFAEGGWVNPVPGGVFANIAEGGYPEAVLSTNPMYRERSARIAQKFQAVSTAPQYKFPQNYAANIAQNKAQNGENQATYFENHFHFHADRETGKFSKTSAQQEIKRMMDAQKNEARRR